jgi:cytochrome c-type biogenesis protein CcmE
MRRIVSASALLILALLLAACLGRASTKIGDIQENPEKYENKTITVKGTVGTVTKLPGMEEGFYELSDDTGQITVTTRGTLPAEGSKRVVRGTIQSQFKLFGKSFSWVIREDG